MQFIIKINQLANEKMELKLDIIDLAIFDFISRFSFSEKCEKILNDGKVYYWISASKIIKDMPTLGITTTQALNRRIDRLIDAELLVRCPLNQSSHKSYFGVGKRYDEFMGYEDGENSDSKVQALQPKSSSTSTQKFKEQQTNKQEKENRDNSLSKKSDKTLIAENCRCTTKESCAKESTPFPYGERVKQLYDELMAYPEWKKKSTHAKELRLKSLMRIAGKDEAKAIASIKQTLSKGWLDFYEPKEEYYERKPIETIKRITREDLF